MEIADEPRCLPYWYRRELATYSHASTQFVAITYRDLCHQPHLLTTPPRFVSERTAFASRWLSMQPASNRLDCTRAISPIEQNADVKNTSENSWLDRAYFHHAATTQTPRMSTPESSGNAIVFRPNRRRFHHAAEHCTALVNTLMPSRTTLQCPYTQYSLNASFRPYWATRYLLIYAIDGVDLAPSIDYYICVPTLHSRLYNFWFLIFGV
jgi:hypothetical protein